MSRLRLNFGYSETKTEEPKPILFCNKCKTICLDKNKHQDHQLCKLSLFKVASVLIILVLCLSYTFKFKKIIIDFIFATIIGYLVSKLGEK